MYAKKAKDETRKIKHRKKELPCFDGFRRPKRKSKKFESCDPGFSSSPFFKADGMISKNPPLFFARTFSELSCDRTAAYRTVVGEKAKNGESSTNSTCVLMLKTVPN